MLEDSLQMDSWDAVPKFLKVRQNQETLFSFREHMIRVERVMLQSMLETIRLYMQAMQETVLNILLLQITEPFLQFEEFSNN